MDQSSLHWWLIAVRHYWISILGDEHEHFALPVKDANELQNVGMVQSLQQLDLGSRLV